MSVKIHSIDGKVIHESQSNTYALALKDAIENGVSLKMLDASNQDICGVKFMGREAKSIDLRLAKFKGCKMDGVEFDYCDISETNFTGSKGVDVKMTYCRANNICFDGATLPGLSMKGNFANLSFYDADISNGKFAGYVFGFIAPQTKMDNFTFVIGSKVDNLDLSFSKCDGLAAERVSFSGANIVHNNTVNNWNLNGSEFKLSNFNNNTIDKVSMNYTKFVGGEMSGNTLNKVEAIGIRFDQALEQGVPFSSTQNTWNNFNLDFGQIYINAELRNNTFLKGTMNKFMVLRGAFNANIMDNITAQQFEAQGPFQEEGKSSPKNQKDNNLSPLAEFQENRIYNTDMSGGKIDGCRVDNLQFVNSKTPLIIPNRNHHAFGKGIIITKSPLKTKESTPDVNQVAEKSLNR